MLFKKPQLADHEVDRIEQPYLNLETLLMRISVNFLGDNELAQDAVHSSFEKVIKNAKKILSLPCQEQESYIVKVVQNHCRDVLRKQKRQPTVRLADEHEKAHYTIADEMDIQADYEREQDRLLLQRQLKLLTPQQQEVLDKFYLQGMDGEKLAETLGIPINTLYKRLERARKALKEIREEGGG